MNELFRYGGQFIFGHCTDKKKYFNNDNILLADELMVIFFLRGQCVLCEKEKKIIHSYSLFEETIL